MKANGLTLSTIKSSTKPLSVQDNFLETAIEHFSDNKTFVVAYLDYKVLIGTFEESGFRFFDNETIDAKFIQRVRVFNPEKELLFWRSRDGLNCRLRMDNDGLDTDVVDAEQVLFGTKDEGMGDYTKLTEDRGTEIILPFTATIVDDKKQRVCVKTRNYITYNEITWQASYVDCRFVGFSFNGNDLGRKG
jgi:CRISPR-associated protein (TIGR03984 family)